MVGDGKVFVSFVFVPVRHGERVVTAGPGKGRVRIRCLLGLHLSKALKVNSNHCTRPG
jgi:hypothetical protein